jgi:hypothetical protein
MLYPPFFAVEWSLPSLSSNPQAQRLRQEKEKQEEKEGVTRNICCV